MERLVPAIAVGRAPTPATKRMPAVLIGRIEIDLDQGEDTAQFLELVARIVRERKRIVLIVE